MQFSSQLLENAVNEFAKLPGIGKKTALRLVLHLIKQDRSEVAQFSEADFHAKPGCFRAREAPPRAASTRSV